MTNVLVRFTYRLATNVVLSVLLITPLFANTLRGPLEQAASGEAVVFASEPLTTGLELLKFYETLNFEPIWTHRKLAELRREILAAEVDGLEPTEYHSVALNVPETTQITAGIELLASQAMLRLASDLRAGRLDPQFADPEWELAYSRPETLSILTDFAAGKASAADLLERQRPPQWGYKKLREALVKLRRRDDDSWPIITGVERLEPGESSSAVPLLRQRLNLPAGSSNEFSASLVDAVKVFQTSVGLLADGRIGPATLAALNVPRAERIRQVKANLERWRWLPNEMGERQVRVNIASFGLEILENSERTFEQRVVVGAQATKTPTFSGRMSYIVANPYWNVPTGVVKNELLPKERKQPGYLLSNNYEVLNSWLSDATPLNGPQITAAAQRGAYVRVRQKPGNNNALGRLKFMFPNSHDVYMHDTPAKSLFAKEQRAFSHGCIRLSDPLALARYLLRNQPDANLDAKLASQRETTLLLRTPYNVHITYFTAWVDKAGELQLRNDVYGRDARLLAALDKY